MAPRGSWAREILWVWLTICSINSMAPLGYHLFSLSLSLFASLSLSLCFSLDFLSRVCSSVSVSFPLPSHPLALSMSDSRTFALCFSGLSEQQQQPSPWIQDLDSMFPELCFLHSSEPNMLHLPLWYVCVCGSPVGLPYVVSVTVSSGDHSFAFLFPWEYLHLSACCSSFIVCLLCFHAHTPYRVFFVLCIVM